VSADHLLHGVAVAVSVDQDGPLAGALVLGPSGAGKSSLALCLIEACPFRRTALVADDWVRIEARDGRLFARPPERLAGLIEIRGFGPTPIRTVPAAALVIAVDLEGETSRLPAPEEFGLATGGPALPRYSFLWRGAEASAPHRLRRMLVSILGGQMPQRTQDSRPEKPAEEE
jgi:hypothetical protein